MIFKESTHEYLEGQEKYISMTTLISSYKPKKNWDSIAQKYLDKQGSIQAVLEDISKKKDIPLSDLKQFSKGPFDTDWIRSIWKWISDVACEVGSAYHLKRELELQDKTNVVMNLVENDLKYSVDLTTLKPGFIYPELLIYSHEYKIAGQADYIRITDNGKIIIRDLKTNSKEITPETIAYYNPKKKKKVVECFRAPISKVPTTSYWSYALQLSGYAFILEEHGFPLLMGPDGEASLVLEQVFFKDKSTGEVDYTKDIPVPYLKKEIKALFTHYKSLNS